MKAIEFFEVNMERVEELLDVHKRAYPYGRPVSTGAPADLLRASIVFIVAAFDAYMHKRCIEVVSKIVYNKKKIPEKCVNYIIKNFKKDDTPRELLRIAITPNSISEIMRLLKKSLGTQTFQKPEQVDIAFSMMELKDPWKKLNRFLQSPQNRNKKGRKPDVRNFIMEITNRRDDIVHEGDLYISRKYQGKLKSIYRTGVRNNLNKFRRIVGYIEKISEIS